MGNANCVQYISLKNQGEKKMNNKRNSLIEK